MKTGLEIKLCGDSLVFFNEFFPVFATHSTV